MLIIVEGPDCVGKTTLVHKLAENLVRRNERVEIRHSGPLRKEALIEYEQRLDDYVPGTGVHVLYDRLHLGELIYGPLKRGESKLTREALLHIELNLASKGALLVIVDSDNDTLVHRHLERGEDFVSPAELLVVADGYRKLQHRHTPVTQFNALRGEAASLPALLISLADALEDDAVALALHRSTIGIPLGELKKPHILLLGDRRGPAQEDVNHQRAFVPYPATSGAYLMRAIDSFAWHGYTCIANAWEEDVGTLWSNLGNPHVVALGREAESVCKTQRIPHGVVPHPQWVRRFHYNDMQLYTEAILEAAKTKDAVIPWQR